MRALRSSVSACVAAALAVAGLDVTVAALRSGESVSASAFAATLAAAFALWGAVALLVGVAVGVVAGSVAATVPAGWLSAWRRGLDDPERDRAHAAGILAAGGAAATLGALVFVFARGFAFEMANKRNGALSTALVAAAATPVAALAWFPLYRLARRAVTLLPRPRAVAALASLAGAVALGLLLAVASVDWRIIDFGPWGAAGAFVAAAGLHGWFWRNTVAKSTVGIGIAALLVASGGFAWTRFGAEPRATALALETAGTRSLLRVARRLLDRDGDGFAARLGGGDCDDRDANVYPGAEEVAGNGRDEDCDGQDLVAVAPPPARPEPPSARAASFTFDGNLLFVTIDTLRVDRLDEKRMPRLAALAKQSVVFSSAYAQAPNTPRSFPSFLTSRFPSKVKWVRQGLNFSPLTDANVTLFEVLREAGLRTVGIFSHFYMTREQGVAQGFDEWDNAGALTLHDSNTDVAAPRIVPRVTRKLAALAAAKTRFAMWTHLFEPHSRYMDHAEFPVRGSGMAAWEAKYDGEVSYTDAWLGKILDALRETGLDERTAVVVFADHGEGFGEHKLGGRAYYFHGETLYDEVLRVPLLLRIPGAAGRVVDGRVMLVDIAPTVAALVKARVPESFQGRSLLGAALGEPLPARAVYAEMLPCTSWPHAERVLIEGDHKLYWKITENALEMYNLRDDPGEQRNLAREAGGLATQLKRSLQAWMSGDLR